MRNDRRRDSLNDFVQPLASRVVTADKSIDATLSIGIDFSVHPEYAEILNHFQKKYF